MQVKGIDRDWVGLEFDTAEFKVSEEDIVEYAKSCGEVDPRFTDPSHADFQAPPTLAAKFVSRRILPAEFPRIGSRGFDAGKTVVSLAPIRPGDEITSTGRIGRK